MSKVNGHLFKQSPVSYLVAGVFSSWALDVKGLRLACLLTALLIALGTAIRCITTDPPAVTWYVAPNVTWLMHVGQALNGLAGPVAMAGPPAVSAAWFPPHQRATATAVGALFGMMGSAAGFVFGPLLVPDVPGNSTNTSTSSVGNALDLLGVGDYPESMAPDWGSNLTCDPQLWSTHLNSKENRINREKKDIRLYIYIEAGWSLGLFLLILIYFPKKPPLPPCASATMQRENFFRGLLQLFVCRRPQFWAICFVYGVSVGVFNVWAGVLDVILKPHGIGEKEAGWIGFYAVCGGAAMSLIVARFADVFSRVMKWLLLFFYVIGTGAFTVFLLAANGVIPASTVILYTTIIAGSTALNAAVPLMFELACELAYPTGEGTTNGVLTIVNNLFGLIFLFVFMIPDIGSMWTNYVLVAASGVCLPLLMVMKEEYNRLKIDEHNPSLNAEIVIPPPDA